MAGPVQKGRGESHLVRLRRRSCHNLDRPHVFRLPALRAFSDAELNRLALLQALESARLNCREVHENVFAILAADEAITLSVIKPLHCSLFHVDVLVFLF